MGMELESHLQLHIDDNIRAGMTPEQARRDALIHLGGLEQAKERHRDRRGLPVIQHLVQDVRFGARILRTSPAFTLAAILTLGLGIGANAAIFSVVNAVLLRPLPFLHAERLMFVWATNTKSGDREDVASYPDFEAWRSQTASFDAMAAFTARGVTLAEGTRPELVASLQVTPGFFELLEVPVVLGRSFVPGDDLPGAPPVAILSDSAWKEHFGGRRDVIGRSIRANEQSRTIVGILPPGFKLMPSEDQQIYLPLTREDNRNHGFLRVIGRLRNGADRGSAQAEINVVAGRISAQFPKSNANVGVNIVPLVDALVGSDMRKGLLLFLGVVALVLLIACTNVANLVLARNASRERELSLRLALGAGRWRIFQQLLTESMVVALAGGTLGLLLAKWGNALLVAMLSHGLPIPRLELTRIDEWVVVFTLIVSAATGILFGVVPAFLGASPDLNPSLREASRTVTEGRRGRRIRAALIVAETALALVLLAGAGLLLKTLTTWRGTPPGFNPANVLVVDVLLPPKKFAAPQPRSLFVEGLQTRLTQLPGVESAALVADLPMNGGSDHLGFRVIGRTSEKPPGALFNIVSAGYFHTMGIPIHAGREFSPDDKLGSAGVIVINDAARRRFWPDEDPIGRQITVDDDIALTIVGVVGDVRQSSLGTLPKPEIFLNALQPGPGWPWFSVVVRSTSESSAIATSVQDAVGSYERDVPAQRIKQLEDVLADTLARPRVLTMLLGVFAALAVVLAAIGLYGVVSYSVAQRKHELSVRVALGASRADLLGLVLRQGAFYSISGVVLGLAGAIAFMRLLSALLPGAEPNDGWIVAQVSAFLVVVALTACYLPAHRGSRVDPIVALRNE